MTVQYFERARFELGSHGRVQLGQLGVELLNKQIAQDAPGLDATIAQPVTRPGYQMDFHGRGHLVQPPVYGHKLGAHNQPEQEVGQPATELRGARAVRSGSGRPRPVRAHGACDTGQLLGKCPIR